MFKENRLNAVFFFLAYVLQVKVDMELEMQQYEKAKALREEQLDRLTQICQEQAVCLCILHFLFWSHYVIAAIGQQRAAHYFSKGPCELNRYFYSTIAGTD